MTLNQTLNILGKRAYLNRRKATLAALAGDSLKAKLFRVQCRNAQREIRRICHAEFATLPTIG